MIKDNRLQLSILHGQPGAHSVSQPHSPVFRWLTCREGKVGRVGRRDRARKVWAASDLKHTHTEFQWFLDRQETVAENRKGFQIICRKCLIKDKFILV